MRRSKDVQYVLSMLLWMFIWKHITYVTIIHRYDCTFSAIRGNLLFATNITVEGPGGEYNETHWWNIYDIKHIRDELIHLKFYNKKGPKDINFNLECMYYILYKNRFPWC